MRRWRFTIRPRNCRRFQMPTAIVARRLLYTHRPHWAGGCAPCTALAGSSRSDRTSIQQPILEAHWRHSVRVGVGSCRNEILEPKLLQKKYNRMTNKKGTQKKTRVLGPMQHLSLDTLFQHAHLINVFRLCVHLAPELIQNNQNMKSKLSLFFQRDWG